MRTPGTSFSVSYDKLLRLNVALAEESIEDHLLEWSRDVTEVLQDIFKDCSFKVVVDMETSPSEDRVAINIWQTGDSREPFVERSTLQRIRWEQPWPNEPFKPYIKIFSGSHKTISECVKEINEKLDQLIRVKEQRDSEIIEVDGKKYKLIKE